MFDSLKSIRIAWHLGWWLFKVWKRKMEEGIVGNNGSCTLEGRCITAAKMQTQKFVFIEYIFLLYIRVPSIIYSHTMKSSIIITKMRWYWHKMVKRFFSEYRKLGQNEFDWMGNVVHLEFGWFGLVWLGLV